VRVIDTTSCSERVGSRSHQFRASAARGGAPSELALPYPCAFLPLRPDLLQRLLAGGLEQDRDWHAEAVGKVSQDLDGHVLIATLDPLDVPSGHVQALGEALLGELSSHPKLFYSATNVVQEAGGVVGRHAR
jgi:hypothetical protein